MDDKNDEMNELIKLILKAISDKWGHIEEFGLPERDDPGFDKLLDLHPELKMDENQEDVFYKDDFLGWINMDYHNDEWCIVKFEGEKGEKKTKLSDLLKLIIQDHLKNGKPFIEIKAMFEKVAFNLQ
ncbi:MAG: hypothetical protein R3250_02730 [Melioribacteraceae bacterium]|nr:hypothetical protein [Melioribacteraceae bacterium]